MEEAPIFSKTAIRRLILPLIIEQFLAVLVGMADTIMVAGVGETAVSGISLVDTLNILLINVFTAMATGGAVIAAQELGDENRDEALKASNQLIFVVLIFSSVLMVLSLLFNYQILRTIYGTIEPSVMNYARTYYYLTALSFPFLAVYNGSAAICRSMGNSGISMKVSMLMNAINIAGNAILIYGFHLEVAGAGISTLLSRITAAVILVWVIRNPKLPLHIDKNFHLGFHPAVIRRIMGIGVPMGVENGLFQGGKLLVAGLVSSFGSTSIAANAVAGTICSFQVIPRQRHFSGHDYGGRAGRGCKAVPGGETVCEELYFSHYGSPFSHLFSDACISAAYHRPLSRIGADGRAGENHLHASWVMLCADLGAFLCTAQCAACGR